MWLSVRAWLQQHKEDMTLHNVCFFNVSICRFVHFIRSCTFMLKVAVLPRLMSRNVEKHITTSIPWKRDLDYMSHFLCFRIDTIIIIFYTYQTIDRYLKLSIWIDICSLLTSLSSKKILPSLPTLLLFVKLRRGSGKDWQGMAPKAKGLKA